MLAIIGINTAKKITSSIVSLKMFITEDAIIAVNRFIPNQNPLLFIADDVFSKVSPLKPENCFKDSSASDFISSITSSNVILPIKLFSSSITGADIRSSFSNILITSFGLSFALRGFFSSRRRHTRSASVSWARRCV